MDLPTALERDDAGLRIATSRYGVELTVPRLSRLTERVETDGMTVVFGSPGRGLPEILGVSKSDDLLATRTPWESEDVETDGVERSSTPSGVESDSTTQVAGAPSRFDLWLNAIPNQGSEVVRTEEAMFAALATLNLRTK